MPFSQSTITAVNFTPDGTDLLVSWLTTSPAGTWFQVYVNRSLIWFGQDLSTHVPYPPTNNGPVDIEVGSVLPGEIRTDFSSLLPPPQGTGQTVTLKWNGGSYLAADLSGFHVYRSEVSGGAVDYGSPIATIPAYTGEPSDGFGQGGFGGGGFGSAGGSYSWSIDRQSPGIWTFAVCSFDLAGNEQHPGSVVVAVMSGPPRSQTPFSDGRRVHYTYSQGTHAVTLTWQTSPA